MIRNPPVVCHNCGTVAGGELAHQRGWVGFSDPVTVIQPDRTYRLERLGTCPVCIEIANMKEG